MATAKKVGYAKYRLSPLKKITDEAKRIRKAKPSMPWLDAVKQASKKYNGSSKAKPAVKAAPKKNVAIKKTAKVSGSKSKPITNNAQISNLIDTGRKLNDLSAQIENLKVYIRNAPAQRDKANGRQLLNNKKLQFAALKKYFNTIAKFR